MTSEEIQAALDAASSGSDSEFDMSEGSTCTSDSDDDSIAESISGDDDNNDHGVATWGSADTYHPVVHSFHENTGANIDTSDFDIVDFFKLFVDDDLVNCFVIETNRYAQQWIGANPSKMQKPHCRVQNWTRVTKEEMYTFIATTLLMGLIKKPAIELYWSKDQLYVTPGFISAMTRNRYQTILRFFHMVNNENCINISGSAIQIAPTDR